MPTTINIGNIIITDDDLQLSAIRAQGPGGQHVNKTSSAIQLQFDTAASSLPEHAKQAIFNYSDYRISKSGLITIKAQQYRSQELNRQDAISRLETLLKKALTKPKKRKPSRPTKASQERRLTKKKNRGQTKRDRGKPRLDD